MSGKSIKGHDAWIERARLPAGFTFSREEGRLSVDEFTDIIQRSKLNRPLNDPARVKAMLAHANLIVAARRQTTGELAGIARSLTDFSYCCYLSDLAVDEVLQGQGIGKALVAETKRIVGPDAKLLLVSAEKSVAFYEKIGMASQANAFMIDRGQATPQSDSLISQRIAKHSGLLDKLS